MTGKKEIPLVHIRFENNEAVQMKRDLLYLEMSIVKVLKAINDLKTIRKKKQDTKNKLYDAFKKPSSDFTKLKKAFFPNIDKTPLVRRMETNPDFVEEGVEDIVDDVWGVNVPRDLAEKEKELDERETKRYEKKLSKKSIKNVDKEKASKKSLKKNKKEENLRSVLKKPLSKKNTKKQERGDKLESELKSIQEQLRRLETI